MGCRELDISDCFIFSTEKDHSAAHFEYSPFGKIISENGSMPEKFAFRFSSEYNDIETGLVYYNYRYYSPELGRWINRDPIGESGGNNLYGFVGNDGVNRWDYLGLLTDVQKQTSVRLRTYDASGNLVNLAWSDNVSLSVRNIKINSNVSGIEGGELKDSIKVNRKNKWNDYVFSEKLICNIDIIVIINIGNTKKLEDWKSGTELYYGLHINNLSDSESVLPYEAVLAHEKGHAHALSQYFHTTIQKDLSKFIDTRKTKKEVKQAYLKLLNERYIKLSIKFANKFTLSKMKEFEDIKKVTKRKDGKFKIRVAGPTGGTRYAAFDYLWKKK